MRNFFINRIIIVSLYCLGMSLYATDQPELLDNKRRISFNEQNPDVAHKRQKNNKSLNGEAANFPFYTSHFSGNTINSVNNLDEEGRLINIPPSIPVINSTTANVRRPRVIDLFCGAGGTSEGFQQAGFEIICGIDYDQDAINTFRSNFPNAHVISQDIFKADPAKLLFDLKLKAGELEVLVASPSCKKYTYLNSHDNVLTSKSKKDNVDALQHNPLVNIIQILSPKWVFLENVEGYKGVILEYISPELQKFGYRIEFKIINFMNYSVPQSRKRIIMLATKSKELIRWPLPHPNIVPVAEALRDLEDAEVDIIMPGTKSVINSKSNFTYHWQAKKYEQDYEKKHAPIITQIRNNILDGKAPFIRNEKGHQRYVILDSTKPSRTITCTPQYIDNSDGALIHYKHNRPITPREAARIQTFPDSYKFESSILYIYKLIGNAVPPLLAKEFALEIFNALGINRSTNLENIASTILEIPAERPIINNRPLNSTYINSFTIFGKRRAINSDILFINHQSFSSLIEEMRQKSRK